MKRQAPRDTDLLWLRSMAERARRSKCGLTKVLVQADMLERLADELEAARGRDNAETVSALAGWEDNR